MSNTGRRGFASMHPDRVREIASQGGKAGHAKGTAHQWDKVTGPKAGRLGGLARARNDKERKRFEESKKLAQGTEFLTND
jgi:uncharacterized protein